MEKRSLVAIVVLLVACGGGEADMAVPDAGADTLAAAGDALIATGGAPVVTGGTGGTIATGGSPGTGGSLGGVGGAPRMGGTGGVIAAGGSAGTGGGPVVQEPQSCPQNYSGNVCFKGPNVPGSRRYMTKVIGAKKYICVQNCTIPASVTMCQSTLDSMSPGYNPYRLCVPSCDQDCVEDPLCKDGACPQ